MATTADIATDTHRTNGKSKLFIVMSALLFLLGSGLGYFGISSGLLPMGESHGNAPSDKPEVSDLPDIAFVPVPTLTVTLPPDAKSTHLRFSAQIEVKKEHQADVEFLMPRILDLMNGYLRALTAEDIERPGALYEIRLQLFRRVVMVVGLGRAQGLLVTEFIMN